MLAIKKKVRKEIGRSWYFLFKMYKVLCSFKSKYEGRFCLKVSGFVEVKLFF